MFGFSTIQISLLMVYGLEAPLLRRYDHQAHKALFCFPFNDLRHEADTVLFEWELILNICEQCTQNYYYNDNVSNYVGRLNAQYPASVISLFCTDCHLIPRFFFSLIYDVCKVEVVLRYYKCFFFFYE